MSTRKNESVGVGGTGASDWSEPTKNSSMKLKDWIPQDPNDEILPENYSDKIKGIRDTNEYEQERGPGGVDMPGGPEELPFDPLTSILDAPEVIESDPNDPTPEEFATWSPDEQHEFKNSKNDFDPLGASVNAIKPQERSLRGPGRPKGSKESSQSRIRRKHPERFITPISPEELESTESAYQDIRDDSMSDAAAIEMNPDEWSRRQDRVRYDPSHISPEEAERLEKKVVRLGSNPRTKYYSSGEKDSFLSKSEWAKLHKYWAQQYEEDSKTSRQPIVRRKEDVPDLVDMIAASDPQMDDLSISKKGVYTYSSNDDFENLQPEAWQKFKEFNIDPDKGIFVRLNRSFKKPELPKTLNPSDPDYDEEEADRYNTKMLLYRLSRNVRGSSSAIFWSYLRDWKRDEIDDGDDYMWKPVDETWDLVSVDDVSIPELKDKKEDEESTEEVSGDDMRPVDSTKEIHIQNKDEPSPPYLGSLDSKDLEDFDLGATFSTPDVPEDIENWIPSEDFPGRLQHKDTGEIYDYRPGLSPWQRQMIQKNPGYFRTSRGIFDNLKEATTMHLSEFFVHEGEQTPPGYERQMKPTLDDPRGIDGSEGESMPGAEQPAPGDLAGFDDPTSSKDAEHGGFTDKMPGSKGGSLEAPAGVFQDTGAAEGFGAMDAVDDQEQVPGAELGQDRGIESQVNKKTGVDPNEQNHIPEKQGDPGFADESQDEFGVPSGDQMPSEPEGEKQRRF